MSAQQEDFVSMGMHAALKVRSMVDNVAFILAGELLCLRQALGFKQLDQLSPKTQKINTILATKIRFIDNDRELHEDLDNLATYIKTLDVEELIMEKVSS